MLNVMSPQFHVHYLEMTPISCAALSPRIFVVISLTLARPARPSPATTMPKGLDIFLYD